MKTVYQPIVDLPTGDSVGFESLTRFEEGSPDQVMLRAYSEDKGLNLEISMAEQALRGFDFVTHQKEYLAINLSARAIVFGLEELVRTINLGTSWSRIVLEITEHEEVKDYLPLKRILQQMKSLGVRIAVDDVGSGYAGLWHILQIDPDILKIDMSLIHGLDTSSPQRDMVDSIVYFAKKRNMRVVAEGIENEAEKDWCKDIGVDFGQGYLFGRPELMVKAAG